MKNAIRIILFVILLLGGTAVFAYWYMYNFKLAFSEFDSITMTPLPIENLKTDNNLLATAVLTENEPINTVETVDKNIEIKPENIEFIYPSKSTDVYKGCKYNISWKSPFEINSINLSLTDAGTLKSLGPITSGVPKNIVKEKIGGFEWKVGNVWPGKYNLVISNINGIDITKKSASLNVKEVPENISKENIEKFCSES